jgi:hypothetical protein
VNFFQVVLFQADSGEVFGLYTLVFQAYLEAFSDDSPIFLGLDVII